MKSSMTRSSHSGMIIVARFSRWKIGTGYPDLRYGTSSDLWKTKNKQMKSSTTQATHGGMIIIARFHVATEKQIINTWKLYYYSYSWSFVHTQFLGKKSCLLSTCSYMLIQLRDKVLLRWLFVHLSLNLMKLCGLAPGTWRNNGQVIIRGL